MKALGGGGLPPRHRLRVLTTGDGLLHGDADAAVGAGKLLASSGRGGAAKQASALGGE